jgi:hypothetical protein
MGGRTAERRRPEPQEDTGNLEQLGRHSHARKVAAARVVSIPPASFG